MAHSRTPSASGRAQESAEQLRAQIYALPPGHRIGSLRSIADELGVGIVTIQQAARVLEHEGLLEVRRGPNGGYYGSRPDSASVERALASYLRSYPVSWEEVLDSTSLLFNEMVASAAKNTETSAKAKLGEFYPKIEQCTDTDTMVILEREFQDLLFSMVNRPLFNLLTRVALRFAEDRAGSPPYTVAIDIEAWKIGRTSIIDAILRNDPEQARFEAHRHNRRPILEAIRNLS